MLISISDAFAVFWPRDNLKIHLLVVECERNDLRDRLWLQLLGTRQANTRDTGCPVADFRIQFGAPGFHDQLARQQLHARLRPQAVADAEVIRSGFVKQGLIIRRAASQRGVVCPQPLAGHVRLHAQRAEIAAFIPGQHRLIECQRDAGSACICLTDFWWRRRRRAGKWRQAAKQRGKAKQAHGNPCEAANRHPQPLNRERQLACQGNTCGERYLGPTQVELSGNQ